MKNILFALAIAFSVSSAAVAETKTETMTVKGWHCAACPKKTEANLKKIDGVKSVSTDREKNQVVVSYDDTKAKSADMKKAIADSGFSVEK